MTIEALSARLQEVERENRRIRATGAISLLGVLAMVAMGQASGASAEVRTRRLVLENATGKVVARLDADGSEKDKPGMAFFNDKGTPVISMALLDGGGGGLVISDEKGTRTAGLSALANGSTALVFHDVTGVVRAGIGVDEDNTANVFIADHLRKARVGINVDKSGGASLAFLDRQGALRIALGLDDKGGAALAMGRGEDQGGGVVIGSHKDGSSGLMLLDTGGQQRANLSLNPDGNPSLFYYDAGGKARSKFALYPEGMCNLSFMDVKGENVRLMLGVLQEGWPSLSLRTDKGGAAVNLGVEADGTPAMSMHDAKGKKRLSIMHTGPAGSMITFKDEDEKLRSLWAGGGDFGSCTFGLCEPSGKPRVGMSLAPDGTATINCYDSSKSQSPRIRMGTLASGEAVMILADAKAPRIELSVDNAGAAGMEFTDANGTVVRKLP